MAGLRSSRAAEPADRADRATADIRAAPTDRADSRQPAWRAWLRMPRSIRWPAPAPRRDSAALPAVRWRADLHWPETCSNRRAFAAAALVLPPALVDW